MSAVTAVPLLPVKRGYLVWLWIAIAVAVLGAAALAWATPQIGLTTLKPGTGPHPTANDVVLVNYEGRLTDGTVFDKSPQPTPFPVTGVVPGFSQGLMLMAKGGRYRLTIPPELGYGAKTSGPIPANSTLVFDVELVDFKSQEEIQRLQAQMQQQMQMMRGGGAAGAGGAGLPDMAPQGAPQGVPAQPGR